jgi:hypothetical protein
LRRSIETTRTIGPSAGSGTALLDEDFGKTQLPGRTNEGDAFLAAALDIAALIGSGNGSDEARADSLAQAAAEPAEDATAAPRMSLHSNSSAGGSQASVSRQQAEYATEMQAWYKRQYAGCCANSGLLWPPAVRLQQEQQQPLLPPHLMSYTPSLQQAGGRSRMALRGHLGPIRNVVISPSGKDVLTASDDGGVQVRDLVTPVLTCWCC